MLIATMARAGDDGNINSDGGPNDDGGFYINDDGGDGDKSDDDKDDGVDGHKDDDHDDGDCCNSVKTWIKNKQIHLAKFSLPVCTR